MRNFGIAALVGVLVTGIAPPHARAEEAASPPRSLLTLQLRGAQRGFTDTIHGVILEHDRAQWDLVITGAKAKGVNSCEVRATERAALFDLQRAILAGGDISVSCVNGTLSSRGGVLIDLDDPKGGSLVVEANRKN